MFATQEPWKRIEVFDMRPRAVADNQLVTVPIVGQTCFADSPIPTEHVEPDHSTQAFRGVPNLSIPGTPGADRPSQPMRIAELMFSSVGLEMDSTG